MPTVSLPYIIPNNVEFNVRNESSLTQTICIYNPYAYDILFKVDNASTQKYSVSNRQSIISSRQKLPLEVTCRLRELSIDDRLQVRFFKWSRHRHGQKPRAQLYLGFREVTLNVIDGHAQRERSPSQGSDRLSTSTLASQITGQHHDPPPLPSKRGSGSNFSPAGSFNTQHDVHHSSNRNGQKCQVVSNIIVAVVLLLSGFLLNKANEDWFSINVMEGCRPQTLAIVSYTLAGVVIIKLLTFR